jgi:uncharacterized protein YciI
MTRVELVKRVIQSLAVACCLVATQLIAAQQKPEPQFKLVQFYMALIKKGPKWTAEKTKETEQLHEQHFAYVTSLLESGKAVIAGPLADDPEIRGVFIFRAQSADEAKTWAANDPAVKAGHLISEMHPWWAEDVMKKPNSPLKLTTVYLAFLKKGPNREEGDGDTPEVQELQKAHLANIQRLADMKKLVVAGPFGDDGDLRGIFVFRVSSLEEAQALCATDPMIKAGRLAVELHPWQVPEGVLP